MRLTETLLKLTSTITLLFSFFCWKSAGIMLRILPYLCLFGCFTSAKAEGSTQSDTEISEFCWNNLNEHDLVVK